MSEVYLDVNWKIVLAKSLFNMCKSFIVNIVNHVITGSIFVFYTQLTRYAWYYLMCHILISCNFQSTTYIQ